MDGTQLLALYRAMLAARGLDEIEETLAAAGETAAHRPTSDRDGLAALAFHLTPEDWVFAEARDRVLLLVRGISARRHQAAFRRRVRPEAVRPEDPAGLSDRALRTISGPVAPAGHCLPAVGVAAVLQEQKKEALAVCVVGDGAARQGEFFEAVQEAMQGALPVLFVVAADGWDRFSPVAGRTFFDPARGNPEELFGVPLLHCDAREPVEFFLEVGQTVAEIRRGGGPRIVIAHIDRRHGHDQSDEPLDYLDPELFEELQGAEGPLEHVELHLQTRGFHRGHLERIAQEVAEELIVDERIVLDWPLPGSAAEPLAPPAERPASGRNAGTETAVGRLRPWLSRRLLEVLRSDPEAVLLTPQRLELERLLGLPAADAPGMRRLPIRETGSNRAALAGIAVGRALAGQRPILFLPDAEGSDRMRHSLGAEAAALEDRLEAGTVLPLRVLAVSAPGADSAWPERWPHYGLTDAAAGAAVWRRLERRPASVVIHLPEDLGENAPDDGEPAPNHLAAAEWTVRRGGSDLTLVAWGTAVGQCLRAADELDNLRIDAGVIELRRLRPFPLDLVQRLTHAPRSVLLVGPHAGEADRLAAGLAAFRAARPGGAIEGVLMDGLGAPDPAGRSRPLSADLGRLVERAAALAASDRPAQRIDDGRRDTRRSAARSRKPARPSPARVGLGRTVVTWAGTLDPDDPGRGRRRPEGLLDVGGWDAVAAAAARCLEQEGVAVSELDLVVAAVPTSPGASVAAEAVGRLSAGRRDRRPPAYDLCAGRGSQVFALRNAWDFLRPRPRGRVLLLTAEPAPGPRGAAGRIESAGAVLLYGRDLREFARADLHCPEISAVEGIDVDWPDWDARVPGQVQRRVAAGVSTLLRKQCEREELPPDRLDWLLPHAPHPRLVRSIEDCLGVRAFPGSAVREGELPAPLPFHLERLVPGRAEELWLGLCVYGGLGMIGAGLIHFPG